MLYIIPTPIGNLGDITLRSIEVLEKVEILLCEDTRVSANLLDLLKIKNRPKLFSYYQEVESQKLREVLGFLENKKIVGLVSDAGTPLLSDPGWLLVKTAIRMGIKVEALPGANALLPALQLSGLPADKFVFLGFLPKKEGERKKILESFEGVTKIAYESPERLVSTVKMFDSSVKIAICRELTKMHEEVISGNKESVLLDLAKLDSRGEIVIVWR